MVQLGKEAGVQGRSDVPSGCSERPDGFEVEKITSMGKILVGKPREAVGARQMGGD